MFMICICDTINAKDYFITMICVGEFVCICVCVCVCVFGSSGGHLLSGKWPLKLLYSPFAVVTFSTVCIPLPPALSALFLFSASNHHPCFHIQFPQPVLEAIGGWSDFKEVMPFNRWSDTTKWSGAQRWWLVDRVVGVEFCGVWARGPMWQNVKWNSPAPPFLNWPRQRACERYSGMSFAGLASLADSCDVYRPASMTVRRGWLGSFQTGIRFVIRF